jgi:F1F0 ATPase subunit 2
MAAWLAGLAIGTVFFAGLRLTITRGLVSPRPALWFGGSLLLRMGSAVAGFYWIGRGDWMRLLSCLIGFSMARLVLVWATGRRSRRDRACT